MDHNNLRLLRPSPRVLVVGDASTREFANPLLAILGRGAFDFVSTLPANLTQDADQAWDFVFLMRVLPVIDPLLAANAQLVARDARVVQVLGPWCEGEERTGLVIDGLERVFWHELESWWKRNTDSCVPASGVLQTSTPYTLEIDSHDQSMRDAIAHALSPYGAVVREHDPSLSLCSGVFVGSQLNAREASRLARFCREMRLRHARVVTLLDFPRLELVRSAIEIGAAEVLGKPLDAARLQEALMPLQVGAGAVVQPSGEAVIRRAA